MTSALLGSVLLCTLNWKYDPGLLWEAFGADFYKLPKATEIRTLSEVMECIVWILKLLLGRQLLNSLCPYVGYSASHTELCLYVPRKLLTDRITRALLQNWDVLLWVFLPLWVWVPMLGPSSGKTAPEKRTPRTDFPPGWEIHFTRGGESEPPVGKKRQPTGLCLEASIWKEWVTSPKGDLQICSKDRNSRGRVEVPDCPLPALQRHS